MSSLFTTMIILVMVLFMFTGQTLKKNDYSIDFIENITWNNTIIEKDIINIDDIQSKRLNNIFYKFIDFFGYSMAEFSKIGLEFGYDNPQYNFNFFMWVLIVVICLPFVLPMIGIVYIIIELVFKKLKKGEK